MKKTTAFFFSFVFVISGANAQERGPAAVSPGSDTGIARVSLSCPTFSWTGMEWATGYKVVVFETNGPNVLSYEEMSAISSPVLKREIQGRALSWTPSSDERLSSGGLYVWYVQAVDGYGQRMWSEGRIFEVEAEVQLVGMEDAVRESLREKGMSEEAIDDVLEDMRLGMKEVVAYGVETDGSESGGQDKVSIQGYEGTDNTFYGYGAGDYIENHGGIGLCNSFLGYNAGYFNNAGFHNTFLGHYSGFYNSDGDFNTFLGYYSGYFNSTGSNNTFLGYQAGYDNTGGNYNTFLGYRAGQDNTTGFSNTFLGYNAGSYNTTGNANVFIGSFAGSTNNTGTGNVFLGYTAGYNETGSNKLYIDVSDTSSPLIWGDFANNILTVHGKFGVGTKSPAYAMELETTGTNAAFVAQRTDGATNYINATASFGNFGTVTNHPLRLAVNSVWRMRLDSDNSLTMANGAMCTAGGTWQNYSKREAKENIHDLTTQEAMDTLTGLAPVKYNYKVDKEEKHVGFIAEDVPELVASKDRNGISAMDIVAVLTKVVQEQQERIKKQQDVTQEQQKIISDLQKQIDELKNREK